MKNHASKAMGHTTGRDFVLADGVNSLSTSFVVPELPGLPRRFAPRNDGVRRKPPSCFDEVENCHIAWNQTPSQKKAPQ
jgi:hypothetical protein